MRQRPLFTVLCVAGTIASGVFLSGQVGPAPPRPALVTLDKADAAKLAEAGRAAVQVEMPAGVELKLWAPDGLIADPVALEVTPDGTVYVAGTQRNNLPLDIRGHQDWMTTAHTMKTVADLRRFYTDVMSPANSAKNGWIPDANGDGSKDIRDLAEFKERVYRVPTPTATASPTSRRSSTRASTTIRRGTRSAASCWPTARTWSSWCRPASTACATPRATAASTSATPSPRA